VFVMMKLRTTSAVSSCSLKLRLVVASDLEPASHHRPCRSSSKKHGPFANPSFSVASLRFRKLSQAVNIGQHVHNFFHFSLPPSRPPAQNNCERITLFPALPPFLIFSPFLHTLGNDNQGLAAAVPVRLNAFLSVFPLVLLTFCYIFPVHPA
jgi:hypothetical protein